MINKALNLLKWPTGLLSFALLPGVGLALFNLCGELVDDPAPLRVFGAGFGLYFLAWLVLFRKKIAGSLFSTFEHELTHALFAWMTFHRVRGLKATWSRGGVMSYEGDGNWLIPLAPYFFPTVTAPVVIYLYVFAGSAPQWVDMILGASVAYHMTSTWREIHWEQTDLREVGFLFSALFLPTANVAFLGVVLAFAHDGYVASHDFLKASLELSGGLWYALWAG